jgi:hypothetical protein
MFSTDPEHRSEYVNGLRQLADYLDAHPRVPVPVYGTDILVIARSAEDGGITEILDMSIELAAPFAERDGIYRTVRKFGPVAYTGVSHTSAAMADYYAQTSYEGCVITDE